MWIEVAGYEYLVVDETWGTIASFYSADEAEIFLAGEAAEIVEKWGKDDLSS